ncbi:YbeD family protein [Candidatus Pseudothioglobus sp. Uisw_086]|uniref:YbeD family protein n=1 Tax=Candidatus Pseudothioglobus sp. Uisw_086 TaxID=3230998 RepID=UPI003A87DAB3
MGKISFVSKNNDDIFKFPCDYPIKIFGLNQPDLKQTICAIVESHIGRLHDNQITTKKSSKGKYVSITIRIIATSRKQLDAINNELQASPLVSYLL